MRAVTDAEWSGLVEERDAEGMLTDLALALDALRDAGCDCDGPPDEYGTCVACRCERALRTERERALAAEADAERLRSALATAWKSECTCGASAADGVCPACWMVRAVEASDG